jgi:hypothetical protein
LEPQKYFALDPVLNFVLLISLLKRLFKSQELTLSHHWRMIQKQMNTILLNHLGIGIWIPACAGMAIKISWNLLAGG